MKKSNTKTGGGMVRISLSLPADLAEALDEAVAGRGAASRSAWVAEAIRAATVEHRSRRCSRAVAGAVTVVYELRRGTTERLAVTQRRAGDRVLASMRVTLPEGRCMEIWTVCGAANRLSALADELSAVRGVVYAKLGVATAL